jgi:uncharacterized protein YbjQ (UPF0145 family)
MLIVTSNEIPGHRIDAVFGEVMGLTVRSRDIGSQMLAGFRSLGGGELAMRFDTSEMGTNWTEVCAYGTAVYVLPLGEGEPGATGQSIYLTKTAAQQQSQQTPSAPPVPPTQF